MQLLRKAFVETLKDSTLSPTRRNPDTDPLTGEKIVLQLFKMDAGSGEPTERHIEIIRLIN